jgi:hypothetical protein
MATNVDPNPAHVINGIRFDDNPIGDVSLDDLFPVDPEQNLGATTSTPPAGTTTPEVTEPQTPSTPPPATWEPIVAGASKYETKEDLIRGITHKDELLERLRQELIARDGRDPITGKPVQATPQAPQEVNYLQNPERLFDDMAEKVDKRDKRGYGEILQKFIQQYTAPFVPIAVNASKNDALNAVSAQIPEFRQFASSAEYRQVLESEPLLSAAISNAENNLNLSQELPGLYRIAYYASLGRKAPEIARAAAQAAPPATPPPARPTTSASTMTPPQPGTKPDLRTSEGRQALIRDLESRGIADKVF